MANKPAKLGNKKSPKKEGESATENKKSEGTVLDADGVLSMKVSKQHGTPFYIRSALSFLKGQGEDKPAVPKLRISALGNAISCAIACASRIEEAKMGKLESCQTTYFKIPGGKFVPQITVLIEKAPGAENIEVKELMPRPPKEGSK